MEKELKAKKIRWNISKTMFCVSEALVCSRLRFKTTQQYMTAMEKLSQLYNLTHVQVWILCLTCRRFFDEDEFTTMGELALEVEISAMSVMSWRHEIVELVKRGFFEWKRYNVSFRPTNDFCSSLYDNVAFHSQTEQEEDEIGFIRYCSLRYFCRRRDEISSSGILREISEYESEHKDLEVVKRVSEQIEKAVNRFILYIIADDILDGTETELDILLANVFDGGKSYSVATEMMGEKHELFQKGLVEFTQKGNISDASISLTDKGKKLVFGEKAFLFAETVDEKDLIKVESIKRKKLFYSSENEKEVRRLKNALQEETLKSIQNRLEADGMPVGVAVLLYGAPGTGKTESVMQIAKDTGRSIVHVDISEAKSAWFGESEKRIKKIFTSYKNTCEIAQKKGEKMPILLFNEADALITQRKNTAHGNTSQTENAMQNIILEELENLRGIFIATTNLATNMDAAFERRFLFKIRFENPSFEAKTSIWMNKLSWLSQKEAEEFANKYDFSGGQIDNIVRKITMNEIISGEKTRLSDIHEMCRSEKLYNPNAALRIGFGT